VNSGKRRSLPSLPPEISSNLSEEKVISRRNIPAIPTMESDEDSSNSSNPSSQSPETKTTTTTDKNSSKYLPNKSNQNNLNLDTIHGSSQSLRHATLDRPKQNSRRLPSVFYSKMSN